MYHRAAAVKASPARTVASRAKQAKATARARTAPAKAASQAGPSPAVTKPSATAVKPTAKAAKPAPKLGKPAPKAASVVTKPAPKATPAATKPAPKSSKRSSSADAVKAPLKAAPRVSAPRAAAPQASAASAPVKKPVRKSIKEAAGVSTEAVARRTGKSWDDWFEVLDSAGAATLDQRGVIAILAQKHGIGPWWQQMIAVGYESLRGKSEKPAGADGFHVNSSCTLDAPLPRVFRLWNDAGERARWLADDRFVVKGATADKLIRARWGKGTSHVAVSFVE